MKQFDARALARSSGISLLLTMAPIAETAGLVNEVVNLYTTEENGVVALAEEATEDAIALAKKLAPFEDSYDATKIKVEGATITLLQNIALGASVAFAGTATVNLSGRTLNLGSGYLSLTKDAAGKAANLTITDSIGGGKVINDGTQVRVIQASNDAILTVGSGATVEGNKTAAVLVSNNGVVNVDGGKVVNTTTNAIQGQTGGIVRIKSGTVDGKATGVNALTGTKVTVSGGTVDGDTSGIYASCKSTNATTNATYCENGNTSGITISGGTISSEAYGVAILDTTKVTISDGNILGGFAITTNGSQTTGATINITGGTFTGTAAGMYLAGISTNTISNANITGPAGIVFRGGTTVINGGTFKATGTTENGQVSVGDSNTTVPAGAIIVDKVDGYTLTDVKINGGTFIGDVAYTESKKTDGDTEMENTANGVLKISGGNFSNSLIETDYLDDDLTVQLKKSGNSGALFSYYNNVNAALEVADEGDIVTDVEAMQSEDKPIAVTFSGNGISMVTYAEKGEFTLPGNIYFEDPEGQIFVGWVLNGKTYSANSTITLSDDDIENGITLTAQWMTPADKTELEATIAEADGLDEDDYVAESWAAMQEVLEKAKELMKDEFATQTAVDKMVSVLKEAIKNLEEKVIIPSEEDPTPSQPANPNTPEAPDAGGNMQGSASATATILSWAVALIACLITARALTLAKWRAMRNKALKSKD